MVINSFRHNKNLKFYGRTVIARRCVKVDKNLMYFNLLYIYTDNKYAYVWQDVENTSIYVPNYNNILYYGRYKLYLNRNGLYFNLGLRNYQKSIKVYLCD